MSFSFSKSKFVSACTHCNKYAWLDKYMPEQKAPVSEYTQSLFDNGHLVGGLAQEYFRADVDVTAFDEKGKLDLTQMVRETEKHLKLQTPVIAEASFTYNGLFCSVDILVRNADGTYDMYEVKSSKREKATKKNPTGVKEQYMLDAAYQRYVLEHRDVNLNKVYVLLLNRDYVRGASFDLDQYFVKCDVTAETAARQKLVEAKLAELEPVLADANEPATMLSNSCNKCDYFGYCGKSIPVPSPFDVYDLRFPVKCKCYQNGISFFDMPNTDIKINDAARRQIEYYNRPEDTFVDKNAIQKFLNKLSYPLYSLDFETYQAVVPAYEGIAISEQVPFQYSLHIVASPDVDLADIQERHFLDLSGRDTRRDIAESLVANIPYGACVMAYRESTERNIVGRLATYCPDLADHLRSFTYYDPLKLFQNGHYYVKAMGKSFSLKSVAPALYPEDPDMNYHNLEGNVQNGTQAMNVYLKCKEYTPEERAQIEQDLKKYCALDTLAVVKILKKLEETA